jgi:hypothetical protein
MLRCCLLAFDWLLNAGSCPLNRAGRLCIWWCAVMDGTFGWHGCIWTAVSHWPSLDQVHGRHSSGWQHMHMHMNHGVCIAVGVVLMAVPLGHGGG